MPLFYYVLHLFLIHGASLVWNLWRHGEAVSTMQVALRGGSRPWFANDLPTIYAAWVVVVLSLWWPSRAYAALKRRSRSPLLSYL